jgi:hypothetical protein
MMIRRASSEAMLPGCLSDDEAFLSPNHAPPYISNMTQFMLQCCNQFAHLRLQAFSYFRKEFSNEKKRLFNFKILFPREAPGPKRSSRESLTKFLLHKVYAIFTMYKQCQSATCTLVIGKWCMDTEPLGMLAIDLFVSSSPPHKISSFLCFLQCWHTRQPLYHCAVSIPSPKFLIFLPVCLDIIFLLSDENYWNILYS